MRFLFALLILFVIWNVAGASGSYEPPEPPPPVVTTTTINNTTIINNDAGSAAALAGAMGMHYFSRSTKSWQGSVSGACYEMSEHCAISGALAKRQDEFLWGMSVTSNGNEQMIGGSFGWTF